MLCDCYYRHYNDTDEFPFFFGLALAGVQTGTTSSSSTTRMMILKLLLLGHNRKDLSLAGKIVNMCAKPFIRSSERILLQFFGGGCFLFAFLKRRW